MNKPKATTPAQEKKPQKTKTRGRRSGAHGDARKAITLRNKARRAAKRARWLAKRQDPEVRKRLARLRLARREAKRLAKLKK